MELDELEALAADDQWTFIRGRIAEAAVALDAALRGLHAQLRGLDSREALLSASQNWTNLADQCRTMIACAAVDDRDVHAAIGAAVDSATAAYDERNRYMHDLLTADVDDELVPDPNRIRRAGDYYLVRLTRKAGAPGITLVTLDEAREVVAMLVRASWQLRAARGFLAGQPTWRTLLLGQVEGQWDGNASWTYNGPDDDDLDDEAIAPTVPEESD